jgi:hypothetical protein
MAANKGQRGGEPPKPASTSKPAKRTYEGHERTSEAGQTHQDGAREEFRDEPEHASKTRRESGRR